MSHTGEKERTKIRKKKKSNQEGEQKGWMKKQRTKNGKGLWEEAEKRTGEKKGGGRPVKTSFLGIVGMVKTSEGQD